MCLDYCYPKLTNQIASLEVTIRDSYLARGVAREALARVRCYALPAIQNATPNCVRVRAQ